MDMKVLGVLDTDCGGDAADDLKYISGLSTILVATIQEVKDRVSQMEFIFCSQLFPHFQAKSKLLQKQLADATRVEEHGWRKREASLLSQLEELNCGKQQAEDRLLQVESSLEEMKGKLVDAERLIAKHDGEKKQLLGRLDEEMRKDDVIHRLEREIQEKAAEMSREKEAHQQLLLQMELKDKDLFLEQNKRMALTEENRQLKTNYKHLKSQYTFALGKIDQYKGSKSPVDTLVNQKTFGSPPSKRKLKDLDDIKHESIQVVSETRDRMNGATSCAKAQHTQHAATVRSLFNNARLSLPSQPTNTLQKNEATASTSITRPNLNWREIRARKEPGVVYPHDDFLDTPLEAVKNRDMNPTTREEVIPLASCPPQDMDCNNSDDETQDINVDNKGLKNIAAPKQPIMISVQPSNKGYKYTEPVRKKAERENLKGVECKQCKKFYDAVLPDGHVNGDGMGSTSMRCEHHDGVSRHRYRYAPPMTPEGFWNIGFESEM